MNNLLGGKKKNNLLHVIAKEEERILGIAQKNFFFHQSNSTGELFVSIH